MSFRLISILWAFAVLAAAIATFGPWGFLVGLAVVAFWMRVFSSIPLSLLEPLKVVLIILIILLLAALFLPAVQSARESSRHVRCINNLRQLGIALQEFVYKYDTLPAAAAPSTAGGPPQSWRISLLQVLEQQPVHKAYRHDKAWNSPDNSRIRRIDIDVYACPMDPPINVNEPTTNYFAIVGTHAAFLPDRGRTWQEFKDSRSQTIMLIELAGREVPWLKPSDLSFDETVRFLSSPPSESVVRHSFGRPGFFYKPVDGSRVHVVFADGLVGYVTLPISRQLATALLTIDGGESVDPREFERATGPQFDYGRCYGLGMFIGLALLPFVRLFRRKATAEAPLPG